MFLCCSCQVTELYDLLNKWDSFVDVVPDLVSFHFCLLLFMKICSILALPVVSDGHSKSSQRFTATSCKVRKRRGVCNCFQCKHIWTNWSIVIQVSVILGRTVYDILSRNGHSDDDFSLSVSAISWLSFSGSHSAEQSCSTRPGETQCILVWRNIFSSYPF